MDFNHPLFQATLPKQVAAISTMNVTLTVDISKVSQSTRTRARNALMTDVSRFSRNSQASLVYAAVASAAGIPTAFMTTGGNSRWRTGRQLEIERYNPELHDRLGVFHSLITNNPADSWTWRNFMSQRSHETLLWRTCEVPFPQVVDAIAEYRPVDPVGKAKALELLQEGGQLALSIDTNLDYSTEGSSPGD